MRKYIFINKKEIKVKKIMIYDYGEGTYLFEYDTLEDEPCINDFWFTNLGETLEYCNENYGINEVDWINIGDPKEGCFHDRIKDIRCQ